AMVVQAPLLWISSVFPRDGLYGAPFAVGIVVLACPAPCTEPPSVPLAGLRAAADLAITAAVFFAIASRAGVGGAVVATLAALAALIGSLVVWVGVSQRPENYWPPLVQLMDPTRGIDPLGLWVPAMLAAVIAALLWRALQRAAHAQRGD